MIILYCIGFFTSQNTGDYGKTDEVNDTPISNDINQESKSVNPLQKSLIDNDYNQL